MPRPRKYKTNADRSRAYRQRKKDKEEALRRERDLLAKGVRPQKHSATFGFFLGNDALRRGLLDLRKEITRRRKEAGDRREARIWNPEPILKREQTKILNYIETELDRLLK